MELHQSQLRLIREQTAIFIRDLAVLQGEAHGPNDAAGANCHETNHQVDRQVHIVQQCIVRQCQVPKMSQALQNSDRFLL